ncbi:Transposase [Porphyromonas macacae]|uniref:Transposase n=1 Tax=Porphyromonas macacae TaxID=28115 RepID=A0A379EA30_9PORP|nr:IS4 family transposase [Porphyromonas macacae]SUB89091.1 Transposase [Porphyromonas macacae]SUB89548.1 Transposase [Porphyromonas macacae]
MNKDKYVFAQLVQFLDRSRFNRIVTKYQGDKYIKSFSCWNQLLVMMFGQLAKSESLRDLTVALEAHWRKLYHLGMGKSVTRSNLSKTNEQRDYRIFEDYAYRLVDEARSVNTEKVFGLDGHIYAFDFTTIDLCLEVFEWAKFRKHKGGIKVHTLYDIEAQLPTFFHITPAATNDMKAMPEIPYEKSAYYIFDRGYNDFANLYKIEQIEATFVVRAKKSLKFKQISWKRRLPKNILSDSTICFVVYKSSKDYPLSLRRVVYYDEEQGREFVFLTNNFVLPALMVAELYRSRWQIELFFKWLKQHLKIKKFWGTSENAVRIQIYCAIITYCLRVIAKCRMKIERSVYEILQIIGISLTDKTNLRDLFNKSNINNVNERFGYSEPSLFNF